jgi:hypothetical protein
MKYTKELLEELVKKSFSIAQVIRSLGIKPAGGNHYHISKKIKMYGIDTSHFTRKGLNKEKIPFNKKSWEDILIKSNKRRKEDTNILRRALIESGRKYKCEKCGIGNIWNNEKLCIQIDHINGDCLNNTKENLRFLCPNCHSQTNTFGSKNIKSVLYKRIEITKSCLSCGKEFSSKNLKRKYCSLKCSNRKENRIIKTKIQWPDKELLLKMLSALNYRQLGIKLGVSDNAIRKHLK